MKNLLSRSLLVISLGACVLAADAAPVPARPALQTASAHNAAPA
ncbi:MAG: hypothetical protein ACR2NX_10000 [Chthoniobacterales bacterium]